MAGADPMYPVLGGRVRLRAMRAPASRVEYLFDRDGLRQVDALNREVAWDGSPLPQNPDNLLGGNQGELRSVAWAPASPRAAPACVACRCPGRLADVAGTGRDLGRSAGWLCPASRCALSVDLHPRRKRCAGAGRYDRLLFALADRSQAPPTVAVYLPPDRPDGPSVPLFTLSRQPLSRGRAARGRVRQVHPRCRGARRREGLSHRQRPRPCSASTGRPV